MTKLASSSMCSTAACHDRAATPNNAKFSYFTTAKRCVSRVLCSTHSRLTTYNSTYFLGFTLQLTLAQFADFTKRRTGINFSICFNSHPMCSARQTLEIFPLIFLSFFFSASATALNSFPWARSKRHRTVKLEQISTTKHLFIIFFVFHLRTAREIDFLLFW